MKNPFNIKLQKLPARLIVAAVIFAPFVATYYWIRWTLRDRGTSLYDKFFIVVLHAYNVTAVWHILLNQDDQQDGIIIIAIASLLLGVIPTMIIQLLIRGLKWFLQEIDYIP